MAHFSFSQNKGIAKGELHNLFSIFCLKKNGILLPKLFWPTVRKKCSSDRGKLLKFEAEGRKFEITRTIYSSSKRSEQFLVTECFLTCSWRFLIPNKLEQLELKLENILGFRNMQEKLENIKVTQYSSN